MRFALAGGAQGVEHRDLADAAFLLIDGKNEADEVVAIAGKNALQVEGEQISAPHGKESAQVVVHGVPQHQANKEVEGQAAQIALAVFHAAALDKARANDQVAALQSIQHLCQVIGAVVEIGIHYDDLVAAGVEDAVVDSAGKSALVLADQAADGEARQGSERLNRGGGAVGASIIDHQNLNWLPQRSQVGFYGSDEVGNVPALAVGGQNDGCVHDGLIIRVLAGLYRPAGSLHRSAGCRKAG